MIIDYNQNKQPDFIGDIHGHFDALEMLFKKMGYEKKNGIYSHSERFPVFVGDYIDRGPKILETLNLVRSMQEDGAAIALMGNHEYNFICYHHKDEKGQEFRENSDKNKSQLLKTKIALSNIDEFNSYMKWMISLPIAIESDKFRAVHAQWNSNAIEKIKTAGLTNFDLNNLNLIHSDDDLFIATDTILKGFELNLPESLYYHDHEGNERTESRVKWWKNISGDKFSDTFASLPEELYDKDISNLNIEYKDSYKASEKPVFFGHYWLNPSEFGLTSENSCCVDFSIAKDGILGAYRFSGEQKLNANNLFRHD